MTDISTCASGSGSKLFRVVLEDEFSARAALRLGSTAFQFIRQRSGAEELWFEAPYSSIDTVSLSKPHLILRSPNGKKLIVTLRDQEDASELLLQLRSLTATTRSAQDAGTSLSVNAEAQLESIAASPEALSEAKLKRGILLMLFGALAFAIGLAITVTTFERATAKGGLYIITWGALLFGPISFLRGLVEWTSEQSARTHRRTEANHLAAVKEATSDVESIPPTDDEDGVCPNCKGAVPLGSRECKHCHASFGAGSAWQVLPQYC